MTLPIVTVSLHSVIDETYRVEEFAADGTFRCDTPSRHLAGKGLNVAYALAGLGHRPETVWMGGDGELPAYRSAAQKHGIGLFPVPVAIPTRRHITITDPLQATTTHIQVRGIEHPLEAIEKACSIFQERLHPGGFLAISGSLPPGAPDALYREMVQMAVERDVRVLLDSSGEPLHLGLEAKPFAIKPNREEAEFLYGHRLETLEEQRKAARDFLERGPAWVLLSDGPNGVLLAGRAGAWHGRLPEGAIEPVNTQGCGDALVAGCLDAWSQALSPETVLRHAVACASANALISGAGLLRKTDVERLEPLVEIREL